MFVSNWIFVPVACGLVCLSVIVSQMSMNCVGYDLQVTHLLYNRYEPRALTTHLSLLLAFHFSQSLSLSSATQHLHIYSYLVIPLRPSHFQRYRTGYLPFTPLSNYPGPLAARITKLWMLYIVHSGRRHVYFKQLHDEYGHPLSELVRPWTINEKELSFLIFLI